MLRQYHWLRRPATPSRSSRTRSASRAATALVATGLTLHSASLLCGLAPAWNPQYNIAVLCRALLPDDRALLRYSLFQFARCCLACAVFCHGLACCRRHGSLCDVLNVWTRRLLALAKSVRVPCAVPEPVVRETQELSDVLLCRRSYLAKLRQLKQSTDAQLSTILHKIDRIAGQ